MLTNTWQLRYEHPHGVDLSFYPSETIARLHSVNLMLDWISEVDDLDGVEKILELVNVGYYSAAVKLFNDLMDGVESINVEQIDVDDADSEEYLKKIIKEKTDNESVVIYNTKNDPVVLREKIEKDLADEMFLKSNQPRPA